MDAWGLFYPQKFASLKLQAFRPATLLKKTPTQVLSCEIWKILKNTYFEEHLNDCFCVLITSSYIDFYSTRFSFLQISSSLWRNWNNRTDDAWGGFLWKSISQNEIFSFWKLKNSFTKIFHGSVKNSLIGI